MTSRLTFGLSFGTVHIAFDGVRLSPCVAGHLLEFPISHRASWLDAHTPESTSAILVSGTAWSSGGAPLRIGPLGTRVVNLRGSDVDGDSLGLELSNDQLIALDANRRDSDLELRVDVTVTVLSPPGDAFPSYGPMQCIVRVHRESWLRLLDQNQIEVTLAIRVPMPLGANSARLTTETSVGSTIDSWARTVALLREAREDFRDGRYRASVSVCRRVLESLEGLFLFAPRKALPTTTKERTLEERWASVFWELKSLTDPAHHEDANAQQFVWTRSDAEAILASVAAMVSRTRGPNV